MLYDIRCCRLPVDMLKNFSHPTLALSLLFEEAAVAAEVEQEALDFGLARTVDEVDTVSACLRACEDALATAQLAGFTSVILITSGWTATAVDPLVSAKLDILCFVEY